MHRCRTALIAFTIATSLAPAAHAGAECGEWDSRLGTPVGRGNVLNDMIVWDPDNEGPLAPRVVIAPNATFPPESFDGFLVQWVDDEWKPIGEPLPNQVRAMTVWDADADGPLPKQLIAAVLFPDGANTYASIRRWDGLAWHELGVVHGMGPAPTGFAVKDLATWDPDDNGPLHERLIVAGTFTMVNDETAFNIAQFDGVTWQNLMFGTDTDVNAVTSWDPDGPGPQNPQLIAAGNFLAAGGSPMNRIARWDGTTWNALGLGANNTIEELTTWDPDGAGPQNRVLIMGGRFTSAGGFPITGVARWNGSLWSNFGTGPGLTEALTVFDPDGAGPAAEQLIARDRVWTGTTWQLLGGGIEMNDVDHLTVWDPDADGPAAPEVVASFNWIVAGDKEARGIARWNGTTWNVFGTGASRTVHDFTTWDPDGPGPEPARLVMGGGFVMASGKIVNRVALFDDDEWQPLGVGVNANAFATVIVSDLTTWDPDATGPAHDHLIAGGTFTSIGGLPIQGLARWDGSTWSAIGGGINGSVNALTTWDPDGAGPLTRRLVLSGTFNMAGGSPVTSPAYFDGTSWSSLGTGLAGINELATWDPDGPGPLNEQIVAVGSFTTYAATAVRRVAYWDGTTWKPFGSSGADHNEVLSVTTWDPDGSGSQNTHLVIGGSFTFMTGLGGGWNGLARWNGTAWEKFGAGVDGTVFALNTWDPDGAGPAFPHLIAGGAFANAGGMPVNNIARWDGTNWFAFGDGQIAVVNTLANFVPEGGDPQTPLLAVGGRTPGSAPDPRFSNGVLALWSTLQPTIISDPTGGSYDIGDNLLLSITAENGDPQYQWRLDGVDLANGPTGSGSTIIGAATDALVILNLQPSDAGDYDCVVTNSCGSATSDDATVAIAPPPACPGDANGDNQVNSADLSVLLAQFGSSVTPGTGADFNNDGLVNAADLSVLLASFGNVC